MESFMESLNRLKDVHENEITGLQNKLLELNSERCRDAQRAEELCAKNRQLREQQRALKENLRALENRLRAGLCDRCMVTQELARKKQQEFESSLLQSLQHVFLLTTELTRLQEENDALKEEVKQLRGPGAKPQFREGAPGPLSPLLFPSLGTRKAVTEKPLEGHEEVEDGHAERPVGYGTSPVAKISPGANLPEPRAPDMSPQHISNQLHGTIAVVRPGSRACSANRGSVNGASPLPPPRSSPPSPSGEHSLPLDRLLLAHSFLQASLPSAKPCESPKSSLQADHLCHLNRHLALPRGSPHSGPQPPGLKAGEAEAWEEPVGLLGLPGALAGVRDPRLEGALHLLLAQQLWVRGRAGGAGLRGPPVPGKAPPSPPAGPHSEGPGGGAAWAALPRGQHPRPAGPGSPGAKEASATQDCVPDKPLDLSEWGRGRDGAPKPASPPGSLSPPGAHTPSPKPPQGVEPSAQSGVQGLGDCTKGAEEAEAEEPPPSTEPSHSLPGPSLPSPSGPGHEDRGRPKLPPCPQRPDGDGHPGEELSKAQGQQLESDELDKPDTSDSEVGLSTEAGATQSLPAEGPRGFCATEHGRGPQKRKRASDQWSKASKKPS
ncbi:CDK5 and ABL1 enzyme substrate 2 isoform X1 [Sagmatias obliquidens]|uniref:CDK5 and ABL1 enzyme substrate 2 isoform X1 n=2 Tax=Sagmatias obliquidens TaxID=3371155 RepID=UPI000F44149D|nr:CDK5 and ABL1 enzyme substrate 2 isoform X1 [Lagenorhynchus obliquidens]